MKALDTMILLLALGVTLIVAIACSGAVPTPAAPTATPQAVATADSSNSANDLATSIAVIQNPPTLAPATATKPAVTNLPDPCNLMTQADVNTATGEQFDAGKSEQMPTGLMGADGTPRICKYARSDEQVTLLLLQGARPYTTQKGLTDFQKTLQPVAGLGEDAFWDTASDSLWVLSNDLGLVIEFDRMNNASVDVGKTLMQKALSRA